MIVTGWMAVGGFLVVAWGKTIAAIRWELFQEQVRADRAIASLVLMVLGLLAFSQLTYASHQCLGFPIIRFDAYRVWFLTQASKYVPGSIWPFAARAFLDQRIQMPPVLAMGIVLWESLVLLATALAIGLTGIVTIDKSNWAPAVAGAIMLLFVGLLIFQMRWPWQILMRLGVKAAERVGSILDAMGWLRFTLTLRLSIYSLIGWIAVGLSFYFLITALYPSVTISIWQATAIYTLAWAGGFLVLFFPSGLGIREALLFGFMLPLAGSEAAVVISLAVRVCWTAAEAVHIILASLLQFIERDTSKEFVLDNPPAHTR